MIFCFDKKYALKPTVHDTNILTRMSVSWNAALTYLIFGSNVRNSYDNPAVC